MKFNLIAILLVACALSVSAKTKTRGIEGQPAPAWEVEEWIQLPGDAKTLDLKDYKDKVVYLYCFQSWCPGCHSRGFPTLKKVSKHFEKADDVAFVAVQTVFEGFKTNTAKNGKKVAKKFDLDIPIGQSGSPEKRPAIMKNYRTGGTPWTIIIDKKGVVKFNGFHIESAKAISLIDDLRGVSDTENAGSIP